MRRTTTATIIAGIALAGCGTPVIHTPYVGEAPPLTAFDGTKPPAWLAAPPIVPGHKIGYFALEARVAPVSGRMNELACGSGNVLTKETHRFLATFSPISMPLSADTEIPFVSWDQDDVASCDFSNLNQWRTLSGLTPFDVRSEARFRINVASNDGVNTKQLFGLVAGALEIATTASSAAGGPAMPFLASLTKDQIQQKVGSLGKKYDLQSIMNNKKPVIISIRPSDFKLGANYIKIPFYKTTIQTYNNPGKKLDEVEAALKEHEPDHIFDIEIRVHYQKTMWREIADEGLLDRNYLPPYLTLGDRDLLLFNAGGTIQPTSILAQINTQIPSAFAGIAKADPAACAEIATALLPFGTEADQAAIYDRILLRHFPNYPSNLKAQPGCMPDTYYPYVSKIRGLPYIEESGDPELPLWVQGQIRKAETPAFMAKLRSILSLQPKEMATSILIHTLPADHTKLALQVNSASGAINLHTMTYTDDDVNAMKPQKDFAVALLGLSLTMGCDRTYSGDPVTFVALSSNPDQPQALKGVLSEQGGVLSVLLDPALESDLAPIINDPASQQQAICKGILSRLTSAGTKKI